MRRKKKVAPKRPPRPRSPKSTPKPKPTYGLGGSSTCNKLYTIKVKTSGIVDHSQSVNQGDCVQWKDMTGHPRTLTFASWPFTEPWQTITIVPNGYSHVYHVAHGIPLKPYEYVPDPQPSSGPPDPPEVVVGG